MSISVQRVSDRLFLALVAVLPLHTVYFHKWISWKPWLVLLGGVTLVDLVGRRGLRWGRSEILAVGLFLVGVLLSWPGPGAPNTFWRLVLALGAGALLLVVTGVHARDLDRVLRTIFWSGAALAATGLVFGLLTNGVMGSGVVNWVNELPIVDRVNKPAYVLGFVAVTNWHQDPGYAALWTNVWFVLAGHAWLRGVVRAPRWVGALVLGGLATSTVLTLSRTGWFGLVVGAGALLLTARANPGRSIRLVAAAAGVSVMMLLALFITDPPEVGNDMARSVAFRLSNIVTLGEIEVTDDLAVPGGEPGDNRLEVWPQYWERFLTSPLRGTGLGAGWAETDFQEPHNLWLQLAAETGILGVAGFLAMLGLLASAHGRPGPVVAASIVVVGLATLTQTVLFEPVLWFVLGLWCATSRLMDADDDRTVLTAVGSGPA